MLENIEKEGEYKLLITWKPYELHPKGLEADLAFFPVDVNEYIREFWKRIEKVAGQNNIPIEFPSALSKSKLALEASEFARTQPNYNEFHDLMFKAYFLEKKDIEKMKVILSVANEAGFNIDELKEELDSGIYSRIIAQSKYEAISLGISAVPAFLAGTAKKAFFTGCQPMKTFKEIFADVYSKNQAK